MALRFNPPPNWPAPPAGWTPAPGWKPDPSWGPPPFQWPLWVEDASPTGRTASAAALARTPRSSPVLFGVALVASILVALLISAVSSALGLEAASGHLGFSAIGFAPVLHRRLLRLAPGRAEPDPSLTSFTLSWPLMVVYGGLIYFALLQAGGFVAGLSAALVYLDPLTVQSAIATATILTTAWTMTAIGVWAGVRAERLPAVVVLGSAVLGAVLGLVLAALTVPGTDPATGLEAGITAQQVMVDVSVALVLAAAFGLPAILLGRRRQASQHAAWTFRRARRAQAAEAAPAPGPAVGPAAAPPPGPAGPWGEVPPAAPGHA